jgi:hypothetical protein
MVKPGLLLVAVSCAALATAADVPTSILRHSVNTSITNKDVLTLAKAGFDEEFIIRTLLGARCNCDTSSDALASLAEQGVSQRVIEVMLDASYVGAPAGVVATSVETAPPTPVMSHPVPKRAARPSPAAMAISGRVPYYQEQSVVWGLWRKKVGVSQSKAAEQPSRQPSRMIPLQVNESWQAVSVPGTLPESPRSLPGRVWHTAISGLAQVTQ